MISKEDVILNQANDEESKKEGKKLSKVFFHFPMFLKEQKKRKQEEEIKDFSFVELHVDDSHEEEHEEIISFTIKKTTFSMTISDLRKVLDI